METEFYKELASLTQKIEGEIIQDLYFYFKTYKLDEELCDIVPKGCDAEGVLIPRGEDIYDMQEGLRNIFLKRHDVFIKNDLYNFKF